MPQWIGAFKGRVSIAAFSISGGPALVGGMARTDQEGRTLLQDVSGQMPLPDTIVLDQIPCWLLLAFDEDQTASIRYQQAVSPTAFHESVESFETRVQRGRFHQAVHGFFRDHAFVETTTPALVPNPGTEPYLDTWPVAQHWLRTSPELHMKRLMARGFDRIYQLAPCFRKGDHGSQHREEFVMLEWYRVFADLNHLIDDVAALLRHLAPFADDPRFYEQEVEVQSVSAVFARHLNLDLSQHPELEPMRAAVEAHGLSWDPEDDWDQLFFLLFLNKIEPHLGREKPLILTDYPASQAALAKLAPKRSGHMHTCFRFEVYIKGVEIANAFYELLDAAEQRGRMLDDNRTRRLMNKPEYNLDNDFLAALESGIPPSAGIALGVDRLYALMRGKKDLSDVLLFP